MKVFFCVLWVFMFFFVFFSCMGVVCVCVFEYDNAMHGMLLSLVWKLNIPYSTPSRTFLRSLLLFWFQVWDSKWPIFISSSNNVDCHDNIVAWVCPEKEIRTLYVYVYVYETMSIF